MLWSKNNQLSLCWPPFFQGMDLSMPLQLLKLCETPCESHTFLGKNNHGFHRILSRLLLAKMLRTPNPDNRSCLTYWPTLPSLRQWGPSGTFCALLSISETARNWFPSIRAIHPFSYHCWMKGSSLLMQGLFHGRQSYRHVKLESVMDAGFP